MAIIKKELKERGAYTGVLLTLGTFLLNGKIGTTEIGKLGVIPVIIANGIVQLCSSFVPRLKENNKKETQMLIKKLAFLIAIAQAFLLRTTFIDMPLQVLDTLMLAQISEELTERGIGNGLSNLFIIQILKDAFTQSHTLLSATSLVHLASIGGLMLPLILFSLFYHSKEKLIEINSKQSNEQTTLHVGRNISITVTKQYHRKTYLPIRVAACGTGPIMHSLSFFMFLGLKSNWLWVYAALLVFMYILETNQCINTYEMANQLKKNQYVINGIRPGEETRAFLDTCVKEAIIMGIPLILLMGFYPFIFLKTVAALSLAKSVPFLVGETKAVLREIESYNLDLKSKGVLLC